MAVECLLRFQTKYAHEGLFLDCWEERIWKVELSVENSKWLITLKFWVNLKNWVNLASLSKTALNIDINLVSFKYTDVYSRDIQNS